MANACTRDGTSSYVLHDELIQIPELKNAQIKKMDIPWSFDSAWRKDVIATMAQSPQDFAAKKPGDYWARVVDLKRFYKATAVMKRGAISDNESFAALTEIRIKIDFLNWVGGTTAEHYVSLPDSANSKSITLDLSKTIFFTSIDIVDTKGTGRFEALGYDYWGSVTNRPSVNYTFVATPSNSNPAEIQITWRIYPMLKDPKTGQTQPSKLVREPGIQEPWKSMLLSEPEKYSYIEYQYTLNIVSE